MAWESTQTLGLTMDEETENYSVLRVNANTQKIDDFAGGIFSRLDGAGTAGLRFRRLTAAQYSTTIPKDENTLYIVTGAEDFTLYLGELPLSGGGGSPERYSAEGVTLRHLMGASAAGAGVTTIEEGA